MNRYYTYVLLSKKDSKLYIGYTNDIKRRLSQHAGGEVPSTKNRRPLTLVHYEYFIDEIDAKAREKYLKSGYGHEQLGSILKNSFEKLSYKFR